MSISRITKFGVGLLASFLVLGAALVANAETFAFSTSLGYGARSAQVMDLQKFLNMSSDTMVASTGAGSPGMETSYYGPATTAAVLKFQLKHGVVASSSTLGAGRFGPLTRAKALAVQAGMTTSGGTLPVGCATASGYSPITGQPCVVTGGSTGLPAGCTSTSGFSPVTGQSCSGTVSQTGPVTASLASTTPAPGVLVAGQATANLAEFAFMGNGTVTNVTVQRIGVSADTTLSNIYLFDGSTRLTDSASITSNGTASFNVPAGIFTVNGSKTISVRSDIASGSAGQTVGIMLASFTTSAGSTTANLSGNISSIAAATTASVAMSSAAGGGAIDPGSDINVWQGTATVGTRNVTFNRLALRQIGSVNASDMTNFRLYVDGSLVASAASLDSNGYVTFTPNTTLNTGARTLKVLADVVGGSSRTYQMSLRGAYDISTTDSNFNVGVLATGTFPFGPASATINAGSLTVVKATDSASGNITLNGSDASLAKYTLTAYGESVKIETLRVGVDISDTTVTSLRNGRVMINGAQYGSTANLTEDSTGTGYTTYTVNYTVVPGSPATVEIRADVFEGSGTALATNDTVQVMLNVGSSNGIPQTSLTPINVPTSEMTGNSLTVKTGTVAMSQTSTYGNQSVSAPQTAYKIASYQLKGSSTEDINVNTFDLDVAVATAVIGEVTNVYIQYGNSMTSQKSTVTATGNTWSPSFTLAKNQTMQVDVYASLASSMSAADTVTASLEVSGTTASSSVAATTGVIPGQTVTIATGSITASLDASSPVAQLVDDSGTVTTATYKFVAVNDSYTITDINVDLSNASTAQTVRLMDGATQVGNAMPGSTDITFTGLSVSVPAGQTKILTVQVTLGSVGSGAGTSGSALTTTLDVSDTLARNSQGTSAAVSGSDSAGNAVYVYKAIPTISNVSIPTTLLGNGTQVLSKFKVDSNGTGTIAWKQARFTVNKTGGAADAGGGDPTISSVTLWDADTNTQVTAAVVLVSTDGDGAGSDTTANCGEIDTTCTIRVSVGTDADDNVEQQISGAKNYELRATIGGTLVAGDNIQTRIASSTATFAAPAIFTGASATDTTFIWSDASATSHDTGTADWNNSFLVKNLPTSTQVLTK